MDDKIYDTLIKAVRTIHSAKATAEQRRLAQLYCEEFKCKQENLSIYGFALAMKHNAEEVRFFGLHLVEHVIRQRWAGMSSEDKLLMKKNTLEYLAKGTKALAEEKPFIKEKAVSLVIDIALREWPQHWSDLLDLLVKIAGLGDVQLELILIALRNLCDEIHLFDLRLTDKRKHALAKGLKDALPDVLTFFNKFLETQFTVYKQAQQQSEQGGAQAEDTLRKSKHLVATALTTLLSFCEWLDIDNVVSYNFGTIFCSLLMEPDFRMLSCQCLLALKLKSGQRQAYLFPFEFMDTISAAMAVKKDDEEDNEFRRKMGEFLDSLGQAHLDSENTDIPPKYDLYLQIMLAVSNYECLQVAQYGFKFWVRFLQNPTMKNQAAFIQLIPQLLMTCGNKIDKLPFELTEEQERLVEQMGEQSLLAAMEFLNNEFEDINDYHVFLGAFRSRLLLVLQELVVLQPEMSLQYIVERLAHIVQKIDEQGASENFVLSMHLEGAITFLECVNRHISERMLKENNQFVGYVEQALKILFEFNTTQPQLLEYQLKGLRSFTTYYSLKPDSLHFILGKALNLAMFRAPSEANAEDMKDFSASTVSARRQACCCVIHVCKETPHLLLPFFDKFGEMVMQMQSQVFDTERILLNEALVAVSNAMNDFEQQSLFITRLLEEPLQEWQSEVLSSCISEPESLVNFLGISQAQFEAVKQGETTISPDHEKAIRRMCYIIQMFNVVAKRAKPTEQRGQTPQHPLAPHLKKILPNLLTFMRSLHALWAPNIRATIPEACQRVFEPEQDEIVELLGKPAAKKVEGQSPFYYQMKAVQSRVALMRRTSYELLGKLAFLGEQFYGLPSLTDLLINSVFAHIEHIENRHLALLLQLFIPPFIKNCPQQYWQSLLTTLLPPIFTFIGTRLTEGWNALLSHQPSQQQSGSATRTTTEAEILEDKTLRDLSRKFTSWLWARIRVEKGKPDPLNSVTSIAFLFSSPEIATPVVGLLICCLSWPDSAASRQAVNTCLILVPYLLQHEAFSQLIGKEMTVSILQALNQTLAPEASRSYLQLLCQLYLHPNTSELAQSVLSSLPDIEQEDLAGFHRSLAGKKEAGQMADKQLVPLFQKVLAPIMGGNKPRRSIGNTSDSAFLQAIRDQKKSGANVWFEGTADLDLKHILK
ncbi:hypothetical protein QOT17_012547 [Balamuthia mandrillaris]